MLFYKYKFVQFRCSSSRSSDDACWRRTESVGPFFQQISVRRDVHVFFVVHRSRARRVSADLQWGDLVPGPTIRHHRYSGAMSAARSKTGKYQRSHHCFADCCSARQMAISCRCVKTGTAAPREHVPTVCLLCRAKSSTAKARRGTSKAQHTQLRAAGFVSLRLTSVGHP